MDYVTILWSMAAAAALLLGLIHGLVRVFDRQASANLAFSMIAVSVGGIALAELGMMHADSAGEWAEWVRWCHVPIFFAILGTVLFVRLYLGTGRLWLAGAVIGMRLLILLRNFASDAGFNFERIASIDRVRLLGQDVSVLGAAATSSWQWLATASGLLLAVYALDAALTLWRKGGSDARRRAVLVGGGIVAFVTMSVLHTQLIIWGIVRMPVMITLPFLVMLAVMAIELSRDVVHASRLARDLGESDRRLELAASAAGLGLWGWDIGRNRMWATDRARALLGFAKADTIDLDRWITKVHPDDAFSMRRALEQASAHGEAYASEYRIIRPDGHVRWVAASGRCEAGTKEGPALIRGVIRDFTEQKRIQDDSDELRRELAHAGRVTMLGHLASALAHELSQPLAAILRNAEAAEMMLAGASPDLEELRAIVSDIHRDDRRAAEVIDRLRALLKRRRMEFQTIAVASLVQDVSSLVRADATARHVKLECVIAAGLPTVSGDRVHLSQVLINLIINAMDAMTDTDRPRRALIVAARQGPQRTVEVAVTDFGAGIPAQTLARIFEPFFTTKSGGMGMGLAVSRTIIEAHGGRLWAENNASGGATFRFTLPAAEGSRV